MLTFIKKHKNLLPILFLAALSLFTVCSILYSRMKVDTLGYWYELTYAHMAAFLIVACDIAIYLFFRKMFKYSVGVTIVIGLFGLLNYTLETYTIGIGSVSIQPISFFVSIIYFILNFKRIKGGEEKDIQKKELNSDSEKIDSYKSRYQDKTIEELEVLIVDKRYTLEARTAASEILADRTQL